MLRRLLPLFLIVCIGLILTFYYMNTVYPLNLTFGLPMHNQIIEGTAPSPYRYRILAAGLVQPLNAYFSHTLTEPAAHVAAYVIGHAVAFPLMLLTLYAWLARWFRPMLALNGVLLTAVLIPIVFQDYAISLYNILEVAFFSLALLLMSRETISKRGVLLAILVVLATLNRETAILIPLAHVTLYRTRHMAFSALLIGLWVVVYGGLRLALGPAPDLITVSEIWYKNTGGSGYVVSSWIKNQALLVPLWLLAAVGYRYAAEPLRRLGWLIPLYVGLFLVFALWHEVRLLLILFPIALPYAVSALDTDHSAQITHAY